MSKLISLVRSALSIPKITTQLIRTYGECCCCHNETIVVTQVTSDGSHTEHSAMICSACFERTMSDFAVKEILQ